MNMSFSVGVNLKSPFETVTVSALGLSSILLPYSLYMLTMTPTSFVPLRVPTHVTKSLTYVGLDSSAAAKYTQRDASPLSLATQQGPLWRSRY